MSDANVKNPDLTSFPVTSYCLAVESPLRGGDQVVGYSLAFLAPGPIATPPPDSFREWSTEVVACVRRVGGRVFDPGESRPAVAELIDSLDRMNLRFDYKIRSLGDVPAVQIDHVDGRRLEVEFSGEGPARSHRADHAPSAESRAVVDPGGSVVVRPLERRPFRFIGPILPFSEAAHPLESGRALAADSNVGPAG